MSSIDLAALIITFICGVTTVVLVWMVTILIRTINELRAFISDLREKAIPVVEDMQGTVTRANTELNRIQGMVGRVDQISVTVDRASRLAYRAFAPPLVKYMSWMSGIRRFVKSLRGKSGK